MTMAERDDELDALIDMYCEVYRAWWEACLRAVLPAWLVLCVARWAVEEGQDG